jgi:hypothetical protein
MTEDHYTFLDVLGNQYLTDQALYSALRFLPAHTRREIVLRHMNSNTAIHALLAAYLRAENTTRAPVNQFTFSFPLDGSPPSDWDEPVVVALTERQLAMATEPIEDLMDHTCAICQEEMGRELVFGGAVIPFTLPVFAPGWGVAFTALFAAQTLARESLIRRRRDQPRPCVAEYGQPRVRHQFARMQRAECQIRRIAGIERSDEYHA